MKFSRFYFSVAEKLNLQDWKTRVIPFLYDNISQRNGAITPTPLSHFRCGIVAPSKKTLILQQAIDR